MRLVPRKLFLTRGMGVHKEELASLTMATTASPGGVWTTVISAAILI